MSLKTVEVQCPYCGETIDIEVEMLDEEQTYIEDCSVCCRPIQLTVSVFDDEPHVDATRSD